MNAYGLLTVAGGNSDSVSEGHPTSSRVTVDVAHWRTAVNDPRIDIKPTDDREAVVREMIDSIPQSPEFLAAAARLRKLTMQGRQMRDLRSSMEVVGQSDSVSEDQSRQVAVAEQARVRDIAPSPLSSQALRFEIQTREEQLKSTADTAKRVLLQSQLEAYRRLLRESEEGANREEKISLSNASLRTVVSGAWRRFKNWFKK